MAAAFPDLRLRESVTLHVPTPIQVEDKRGSWTSRPPARLRISVAAALPDLRFRVSAQPPIQVEDKRGSCTSRRPFRLRISVAAAPPDPHSG